MILLDTHVVLWWQAGGSRLSSKAAQEIDHARIVLISPITCWEIGALFAKGRVSFDRDPRTWIRDLFGSSRVEVAPLTPEVAMSAALLGVDGMHGDPADRFLCATAQELAVPLVTKDEQIHQFALHRTGLKVIW